MIAPIDWMVDGGAKAKQFDRILDQLGFLALAPVLARRTFPSKRKPTSRAVSRVGSSRLNTAGTQRSFLAFEPRPIGFYSRPEVTPGQSSVRNGVRGKPPALNMLHTGLSAHA